jgi:transcription elongation GreA/GreB family factor
VRQGQRTFQLVGDDAANPALGLLSWVAPLAAAMLGHGAGDRVDSQDRPMAVISIQGGP